MENTINLETAKITENPEFYNIDACFMLDSTGSMQPSIDMARDKIKQIITELKAQYSDAKVRIAVVAYRDFRDAKRFEIFPFDESVDAAHNFLASIIANGGGDNPEDVNGGFRNSLALKWSELATKMLYHLSDAPCHGGKRFHNTTDHYPKGLPDDEDWEKIFKEIYERDINYLYFDIDGSTKQMFDEFKKMYDSNGEKTNLVFHYEELHFEKPSYKMRSGFREMAMKSYSRIKEAEEPLEADLKLECYIPSESYIRSAPKKLEKTEDRFTSATVYFGSAQREKNISYRSSMSKKY